MVWTLPILRRSLRGGTGRNGKSLTTRSAFVSYQDFSRGGILDVAPVGLCHEHCQKGLEFDPDYLWLLWILGNAYQGNGNYELALRVRKRAIEISPGAPIFVAELGSTYAAAGEVDKAFEVLKELDGFQHAM